MFDVQTGWGADRLRQRHPEKREARLLCKHQAYGREAAVKKE